MFNTYTKSSNLQLQCFRELGLDFNVTTKSGATLFGSKPENGATYEIQAAMKVLWLTRLPDASQAFLANSENVQNAELIYVR